MTTIVFLLILAVKLYQVEAELKHQTPLNRNYYSFPYIHTYSRILSGKNAPLAGHTSSGYRSIYGKSARMAACGPKRTNKPVPYNKIMIEVETTTIYADPQQGCNSATMA